MKTFSQFVAESIPKQSFEIGDWVYQSGSDFESWGRVVSAQKNGGYKVAVGTPMGYSMAGKAKFTSTKGWHPAPTKIDPNKIPPKVKQKIDAKTGPMAD